MQIIKFLIVFILLFLFGYAWLSKILLTEVDRLIRETDKSSSKYKEMVELKEKESLYPRHLLNVTKTLLKWEKIEKKSTYLI